MCFRSINVPLQQEVAQKIWEPFYTPCAQAFLGLVGGLVGSLCLKEDFKKKRLFLVFKSLISKHRSQMNGGKRQSLDSNTVMTEKELSDNGLEHR